eukprot:9247878-Pyramimonas_sp.AAC.1
MRIYPRFPNLIGPSLVSGRTACSCGMPTGAVWIGSCTPRRPPRGCPPACAPAGSAPLRSAPTSPSPGHTTW